MIISKSKFKRIFFIPLIITQILLTAVFFPIPLPKAQALAAIDQVCSTGVAGSTHYTFLTHEPIQAFIPTKNTLDAISVYIKGDIGPTFKVKMSVASETTGTLIASQTQTITNQWGWVIFDFNNVVMPYGLYGVVLRDVEGKSLWKHGPANCYDRGYAVYDNQGHLEFDYGFAVYAYDSSSQNQNNNPAGSAASSGSSSSSTGSTFGTSAGSNQPPSATTSSSIQPPTNLQAKDVPYDKGGSIFLQWFPSVSKNIYGYKIFRSENANSGFVEIAKTAAIVGGYIDKQATTGKTFYYFIRSYQGNLESASSNIASAKSVDNLTALINELQKDRSSDFWSGRGPMIIAIIIVLGLIFFFIVILIIGYLIVFRKKKPTPPASQSPTTNQSPPAKK